MLVFVNAYTGGGHMVLTTGTHADGWRDRNYVVSYKTRTYGMYVVLELRAESSVSCEYCPLQTRRGTPAQGLTAKETVYHMRHAWRVLRAHRDWPKHPATQKPLAPYWSMDNVPYQAAVAREWSTGIRRDMDLPGSPWMVPAHSPDLHQVVEHALANTADAWKRVLQQRAAESRPYRNVREMEKDLRECFRTANPPQSIQANITKLLERTYRAIQEAGGGWPSKEFR